MSEETTIIEEIAPEEVVIENEQDQEQEQEQQPEPEKKEETEQEKYSKRVQKRIDKLEWEKNEERRRVYALQQELEALRSPQQQRPSQNGAPNPDDFAAGRYDPDYLEALTDYKTQLAVDKIKESARIEQTKTRVAKLQQEAASKYSDYEEVTEEFLAHPIADVKEFNDLLMDTDNPIELAYFLGKNTEHLDKISNMTPAQAARYIGRLEAQIEQKPKSLEPEKKLVSNAPRPVSPVGSAKPTAVQKSPDDMTMEEYTAWRQGKK